MRKLFNLYMVLSAVILLFQAGCRTTGTTGMVVSDGFSEVKQEEAVSREKALAAGDMFELSVEVDGRMEVAMHQAKVDSRGTVTLPLVGDLKVEGLTIEGIRQLIIAKYSAYYVNPPVIMIASIDQGEISEWGNVKVLGRVNQPGMVALTSNRGLNLSAAIQAAGGFAGSAKTSDIRISRTSEDGEKVQVSVDFDQIGLQGNAAADLKLIDGDIVYVPERIF